MDDMCSIIKENPTALLYSHGKLGSILTHVNMMKERVFNPSKLWRNELNFFVINQRF